MDPTPRSRLLRGLTAPAATLCLGAVWQSATDEQGSRTPSQGQESDTSGQASPVVDLPQPEPHDGISLAAALTARGPQQSFGASGLSPREMGQLKSSAQAITASWGGRTVPSAEALCPRQLCAAAEEGVYS